MTGPVQDILEHADELAQRSEDYEPSEGDEVPLDEYLLKRAVMARARCEGQIAEAVISARRGASPGSGPESCWGTSQQAAQQRYDAVVEQTEASP
ncbi:hypothetical protein [Candidatus Poriferisocius sp.]|uniref:hypothetical protein n=1 Tax=Candidatus Poriferisocius sp. TaxID=3101276 RepID=UPI003B023C0A